MGWTSHTHTGQLAVTTDMSVKFIAPIYFGETIAAACSVTAREGPKIHLRAELRNAKGVACTVATGVFHALPEERYRVLVFGP
ncbi:MAG: PaaI family thioesterase [Bacteroidota bacterium]